ncbi:hypothetical protein D6856_07545 [Butyrivibrio sp. XB500-5]|uniref:hypothetical protein n=1 Tax=Butyrivibrio sp. XB500-5 TaxID=2364880 RepID=UPI000EAA4EDF|nr:hypothetical protein [Butyrivibrio sp. XB500-5]RKM60894.1 hypothetical protein D6856_07545 [Butyrivibrio sp. XB500-5]
MNNYRDSLEIDLKDLLSFLVRHMRFFVIVMVIGCTLGSAYGFMKENLSNDSGNKKEDSVKPLLTSKEIYEVNSSVNTYTTYFNRYNEVLKYKNESPLMEIDGYNAPKSTCTYVLSCYGPVNLNNPESSSITNINNSSEKTIVDNIINLYSVEINKDDTVDKVKKAMGSDLDDRYVRELYFVEKNGFSLMTVTAYGRTLDESKNNLQQLMQAIEEKSGTVAKSVKHEITVATTTSNYEKSSYIISNKDSINNQLKDLNNSMMSVAANLSGNQKTYFTELLDELDIEYGIEKAEKHDFEIKTVLKYGIFGCAAAAFVLALIYSALYVLSPTLKTEDDLKYAFQIPVIGTVKDFDADNMNIISSGICATVRTKPSSNIYIVSSYMDDNVEAIKLKIIDKVKEKNVQLKKGISMITDFETLDNAIASDGIVLLETIRKSRYENIEKELELCKNYNIKILGAVINSL